MDIENFNHLHPKTITMYGDLSLERAENKLRFPEISYLFFSQSFHGDMSGTITMVSDLNIRSLKRSQVGYVEGIMSEAFNMLSQEIIFNICDFQSMRLLKLPTKAAYNVRHNIHVHSIYKLNLLYGYCHCGINLELGGKK